MFEMISNYLFYFKYLRCFHAMTQLKVIRPTFTMSTIGRSSGQHRTSCTSVASLPSLDTHLDDPSDDELPALGAAGSEEDMEVMLAIFPSIKLVEHSIWEGSEALGTDKAVRMEQFSIAVHYFCFGFEAIFTASTGHAVEVHNSWHDQR